MASVFAVTSTRYCSQCIVCIRVLLSRIGRHHDIGHLASLGLIAVLVALPGAAIMGAVATYEYGAAAENATRLGDAYEAARYDVAAEESLERKYRLEPSPEVRARHHQAAEDMVAGLARARMLGSQRDATLVDAVLVSHKAYLAAVDRMFAAVDAGDFARYGEIDENEADPAFDAIEMRVFGAAATSNVSAGRYMKRLARLQTNVLVATPLVFAVGLGLVMFFWHVLRSYQTQVREASAREAAAARRNEQHFRSLIQHASDLILTCTPDGVITYQSPAAETTWDYPPSGLLDRHFVDFVHCDEHVVLQALWTQVIGAPRATRDIELRFQDRMGNWRYVELNLTSLLDEPTVGAILATVHDIHRRKLLERELKYQAFYDSLTGLPNRALFHDRLKQALIRGARRNERVGLLFLDLDDFKRVNDSLGHPAGDKLLVEAAQRLLTCLRAEDTVARLGGDEFVVILEHLSDESDALPVADIILDQFAQPFIFEDREVVVTASIGIALSGVGRDQAENLLRDADVAMYRAKASGKSRHIVFAPSMYTEALARLILEVDLRHAIENGELQVHYQPIVSLPSGEVIELEALIRWQHPTRGLTLPQDFIPLAEDAGLIVQIGQWVLQQACRQAAEWHMQYPMDPPLVIGVNVSPRQFRHPGLAETVAQILHETGLPAALLKLEITEGVIMHDAERSIDLLWQFRAMGIKLAVDDFGTGYSSLAYLKNLPIDTLKIDRSFVNGIVNDPGDRSIVRAILSLAASLKLSVTAEGIETVEQAAALSAWHCERGQGYHFSKPLDATATASLLAAASGHEGAEQAA